MLFRSWWSAAVFQVIGSLNYEKSILQILVLVCCACWGSFKCILNCLKLCKIGWVSWVSHRGIYCHLECPRMLKKSLQGQHVHSKPARDQCLYDSRRERRNIWLSDGTGWLWVHQYSHLTSSKEHFSSKSVFWVMPWGGLGTCRLWGLLGCCWGRQAAPNLQLLMGINAADQERAETPGLQGGLNVFESPQQQLASLHRATLPASADLFPRPQLPVRMVEMTS